MVVPFREELVRMEVCMYGGRGKRLDEARFVEIKSFQRGDRWRRTLNPPLAVPDHGGTKSAIRTCAVYLVRLFCLFKYLGGFLYFRGVIIVDRATKENNARAGINGGSWQGFRAEAGTFGCSVRKKWCLGSIAHEATHSKGLIILSEFLPMFLCYISKETWLLLLAVKAHGCVISQ